MASMLSARQCTGASTTGRTAHDLSDFAYRSHDHLLHLSSRPPSRRAPSFRQQHAAYSGIVRQSLGHNRSPYCEQHGQPRCRHRQAFRASACSSSEPFSNASSTSSSGRPPTIPQILGRAALLTAVFGAWCLVSASTGSSAFASVTSALTDAGASDAAAHGAVKCGYAGLAAGCLHSLAGVDHLAVSALMQALTPFTIGRSHVAASLLGALWGFGHSTGQLIMGLVMIILKDRFEHVVPVLNKLGNTTVGLTLMLIGILGIVESRQHQQETTEQLQPVTAEGAVIQDISKKQPSKSGLRYSMGIFATGIVYGCNPDALFCVIPALTLPTKLAAATYTAMFVIGTVGAMGAYTAFIGAVSSSASDAVNSRLSTIASGVALVVGLGVLLSGFGVALPVSFSLA